MPIDLFQAGDESSAKVRCAAWIDLIQQVSKIPFVLHPLRPAQHLNNIIIDHE